jgi:hypothetical protein
MATLESCASIFQLAFGVNAVVTASQLYFRRTHREIAQTLYIELRPGDSTLSGAHIEHAFERYVFRAIPGLRAARFLYRLLMTVGLAATLLSLVALVASALQPWRPVPVDSVWIYAGATLVLLPMTYWLYERFLDWLQRAVTGREWKQSEKIAYWETFVTILPTERLSREADVALADAYALLFRLKLRSFGERLGDWLERLKRPFT